MASCNSIRAPWLLVLFIAWGGSTTPAGAQDFRVDTELFENEAKEPFLQTLTIFTDGIMYDFLLTEPREVTVIDQRRGRLTLLDESRRIKASITTQEVLDFVLALEAHAAKEKDRLFSFCAAPQFETTENPVEQNCETLTELHLVAKPLSYDALGQRPQHPEAARTYRQFADWAARVNATRPGNLPPGPRLALNQALAQRELLPLEIVRTIPASGPLGKKLEIKSQHRVNWLLAGEDQKKIERAGDMMATFQTVSYDEYRRGTTKLPAAKHAKR